MTEQLKKLLIVGASGHAKVILDIAQESSDWQVVGLIDAHQQPGSEFAGAMVLGDDDDIARVCAETGAEHVIVAIGDNCLRAAVQAKLREAHAGLQFAILIHPSAVVAKSAEIEPGTVIMAGAIINPACRIGCGCIVNSRASLDHDTVVADFASIGPGAITGGNCAIGAYSAIGIGAKLNQGTTIGEHTVIGSGATVVNDIGAMKVAVGTPASAIRDRVPGEKYL